MQTLAHTPGPWNISGAGMDRLIYSDSDQAWDLAIVRCGGNDRQTEANARLIAAAPDLLAALEALLRNGMGGVTCDPAATYCPEYSGEVLIAARAAIAKAKGGA